VASAALGSGQIVKPPADKQSKPFPQPDREKLDSTEDHVQFAWKLDPWSFGIEKQLPSTLHRAVL